MDTAHVKKFFMKFRQRWIFGLLIFNIFLCELFYFNEGIAVAS